MPGLATETHPIQNGGYACRQFYGTGQATVHFAPLNTYNYAPLFNNGFRGGRDVTDNKTNDLVSAPLYTIKPSYVMNDIFHREDERLKTFDSWPLEWLDKVQLAQTGMFFTGETDKVKCYFCEVEIGRWEQDDQPVPEHMRWSPNCPLLRRRTTNNVPISIEALDRLLPPVSYDICGANDSDTPSFTQGAATPRMMTSTAVNTTAAMGALSPCSLPSSSTTYFPEYPEYAIEAARVRSFADWPRHMKQKPEQLAEAGFFYTGGGDRVKCFSCGGGLKDWNESDEPWEQHAIWLKKCRFLKLMKGQSYIDAKLAQQKAKEAGEEQEEEDEKPSDFSKVLSKPLVCAMPALAIRYNCDVLPQSAAEAVTEESAPVNAVAKKEELPSPIATASSNEKKLLPHATIPEEKLCKICYAGEYNTAFLPCGHVVACAKCASSVTKCPLCRKPFTDVMRVYFS